jgi:hypothetical protein
MHYRRDASCRARARRALAQAACEQGIGAFRELVADSGKDPWMKKKGATKSYAGVVEDWARTYYDVRVETSGFGAVGRSDQYIHNLDLLLSSDDDDNSDVEDDTYPRDRADEDDSVPIDEHSASDAHHEALLYSLRAQSLVHNTDNFEGSTCSIGHDLAKKYSGGQLGEHAVAYLAYIHGSCPADVRRVSDGQAPLSAMYARDAWAEQTLRGGEAADHKLWKEMGVMWQAVHLSSYQWWDFMPLEHDRPYVAGCYEFSIVPDTNRRSTSAIHLGTLRGIERHFWDRLRLRDLARKLDVADACSGSTAGAGSESSEDSSEAAVYVQPIFAMDSTLTATPPEDDDDSPPSMFSAEAMAQAGTSYVPPAVQKKGFGSRVPPAVPKADPGGDVLLAILYPRLEPYFWLQEVKDALYHLRKEKESRVFESPARPGQEQRAVWSERLQRFVVQKTMSVPLLRIDKGCALLTPSVFTRLLPVLDPAAEAINSKCSYFQTNFSYPGVPMMDYPDTPVLHHVSPRNSRKPGGKGNTGLNSTTHQSRLLFRQTVVDYASLPKLGVNGKARLTTPGTHATMEGTFTRLGDGDDPHAFTSREERLLAHFKEECMDTSTNDRSDKKQQQIIAKDKRDTRRRLVERLAMEVRRRLGTGRPGVTATDGHQLHVLLSELITLHAVCEYTAASCIVYPLPTQMKILMQTAARGLRRKERGFQAGMEWLRTETVTKGVSAQLRGRLCEAVLRMQDHSGDLLELYWVSALTESVQNLRVDNPCKDARRIKEAYTRQVDEFDALLPC